MLTLIGTITGIMTFVNLSPEQNFTNAWLTSFAFAFMVMLPAGGLLFAVINKLINHFFSHLAHIQKKLLQGVLMAVVMEGIMATITTAMNHDFIALTHFFTLFINSFLYALPVGLTFACLMTLVLQPKLERLLGSTTG
ncbi:DUF2798 domain-containing protein [Thalassotalea piscium]